MTDQTGQPTPKKKAAMNGDWKKIMFQVYGAGAVFIIALGVIWQSVLLPQLREGQATTKELREEIPLQTIVLKEIRDQGIKAQVWREQVTNDHSLANEKLDVIVDQTKDGCSGT